MSGFLAIAGASAIAVGGGLACFRRLFVAGLLFQAAGTALVGAVGVVILVDGSHIGAVFSGRFEPQLGLDPLSAVFLLTLGLVGAPALVFATRYLTPTPTGRMVGALTAVFTLSLLLVLSARDPLLFLGGWELMSLAPAATILVTRGKCRSARHAVFVYIALTHLAGAGTWIAVLLVARTGGMESRGAFETGSGLQVAVALAALVGMGTKAGLVPLHTWLPRAHPIAPAHVSALMSGVMVKVALYGLIRVLAEWVGVLPVWLGALVLAVGAVSAVTGIVYALFQRELKRLLAFSTVENVGIVTLALGAAIVLRSRGADGWAGVALAAGLLHVVNHAVFKGLLFLGAGAFERAVGSLEIDRLGGLLRRLPLTGTAFLAGCIAITGVPPFNGFASEWLTLQVLLRVPYEGELADGVIGALGLGALAATAALALFCFVKVVGLVLLGPTRVEPGARIQEVPRVMTGALVFLALSCLALGVAPGLLYGRLTAIESWGESAPTRAGLVVPSHRRSSDRRHHRRPRRPDRCARAPPTWPSRGGAGADLGVWPARRAVVGVDECGLHEAASARAGDRAATGTGGRGRQPRRDRPARVVHGSRTAPLRRAPVPADHAAGPRCGDTGAAAPERSTRDVRRLPDGTRPRAARPRQVGRRGMTAAGTVAAVVEVIGGVALAPLLPGLVQHWKARLQGRRGPTPLQPYRELRRLWAKSAIDVEGSSFVYAAAPAVVVAATFAAVLLVPVVAGAPDLGVGHDLFALAGLLALARLVVALSAWDVANGFSLMGASRDLTIAVFVEVTTILAFGVAALVAGTTNLAEVVAATAGARPWESPALPLGAVAFALVLVSETGRQPIDNPDTHLELTMIHEGPLLEYGGRDLAMLQWAGAARHWIVLVVAAQVFVPHPTSPWGQLAVLPVAVGVGCAGLAVAETLVAKMRILLAPRLVGIGAAIALLGVAAWIVETA